MKSRGVEEYKAQIRCFIRKESKEEEESAWLRLHTSVKGPTDTVASPVHRLFSSLTMSESVVQNIITCTKYHHCLVISRRRKNEDHEGFVFGYGEKRKREREQGHGCC